MTWPITFAGLSGGNQPLVDFDTMFQQVAAISTIPCSATGTNAISLTPLTNNPALTSYVELCSFRFRALGSSSGVVTAQHNGLGLLPVYRADGVTQITTGDILVNQEYIITYSLALNGGAGGFFLENPAYAPAASSASSIAPPAGRLTFQSAVPVMSSSQLNQQTIYYAPYNGNLIAIYNGTTISTYQFTANNADQVGLSLVMGGSANWPTLMYDLFVTQVGGAPVLCSLAWTNNTTRAIGLSIFGGFLTNTSLMTARTSGGTLSVGANQGTYVGSFFASANGTSQWQFGAAASGGTAGLFYLYNYYNQILVNSVVTDSGALYTYSSATVRQARASAGNGFTYVQGSSEKAALFHYATSVKSAVGGGGAMFTGLGSVTNAFTVYNTYQDNATGDTNGLITSYGFASTGLFTVSANEGGDGSLANTFNASANNKLNAQIWL